MNKKILNVLNSFSKKDLVLFFNEDLKKHNSFNIGGIADCFVVVNNDKTLKKIVSLPAKHFLIGAGTNLLFKKKKYNEIILKLGKNYKKIKKTFENEEKIIIEAGAGVNLFTLNLFLRNIGIPGLEWSYGIPEALAAQFL
jgi:UDP-N-acetylmuramate dehydrogenase